MPRSFRTALPLLAVLCPLAFAQPAARPATRSAAPVPAAPAEAAPVEVRIGESSVSLAGPWKFAPGDSPRTGNAPIWASPSFDDSSWFDMDLHTRAGAIDPTYGASEFVPGWTDRGFPKLAGFAWYRLRIHIADPAEKLAIKMPDHVDDAYQIYGNGQYLGEFGYFTAGGVEPFRSRALTFALPPPDAGGDIVLAIRFYMEPYVLVDGNSGYSGGMHEAPLVGRPMAMDSIRDREHGSRMLSVLAANIVSLFMLVAAAGAFWIWLIDRPRRTFLWLTCGLALVAATPLLLSTSLFTFLINQDQWEKISEFVTAAGLVCWILFWRNWFSLSIGRMMAVLFGVVISAYTIFSSLLNSAIPLGLNVLLYLVGGRVVSKLALGVLLFHTLWQGARKDRVGALVALPPVLLLAYSLFSPELLSFAHVRTSVFLYGVQVTVTDAALTLMVLVTAALGLRRFIGTQVSQKLERQTIDQELEQARELQQHVLIPETNTSSHFTVRTAYHPARTVGGDFFQVLPYPDGSLLVIVGDVSGKGMAAAMLVAVLVGALRTVADRTPNPAEILATLNERLIGRAGSHFATCIVALLEPGGRMRVACAGHLPPYLNGSPLDMPAAMPLGIERGAHYKVISTRLAPDDTLTFLTDGVLEARNASGRLLGFDETAKLSSQPPEAIAQAAIAHGQDDDITVVGVRVCPQPQEEPSPIILETSPA